MRAMQHTQIDRHIWEQALSQGAVLRQIALTMGLLSGVLYVAATMIAAAGWPEYSAMSQTISELSAIDAPSRPTMTSLMTAYSLLIMTFAFAVVVMARRRRVRIVGVMLLGYSILCVFGPLAPMHMRGIPASLTDSMHIALTAATVVFIVLAIGFGAAAFGHRFRLYSIASGLVILYFGGLSAMDGPRIAANLPTPLLGLNERISIFAFML